MTKTLKQIQNNHKHIPYVESYGFTHSHIEDKDGFSVREECAIIGCGWSKQYFQTQRPTEVFSNEVFSQ